MKQHVRYVLLILLSATIVSSCLKEQSSLSRETHRMTDEADKDLKQRGMTNTFKGPEVHVGDGKVRSFIVISHSGVPQELGFELTHSVMQGLPSSGENSYIIPLHQKSLTVTPFDHMELDWNPQGHPPVGIYTVPHFDFHFYKISLAAQLAIPAEDNTTAALFNNYPPAGYLPAGYVPGPGGVAQMGLHWLDVTSGEFHGSPFTKTFVYGTYNGEVTFYEPMVTKAFIESTSYSSADFRQPLYFAPSGSYYPTRYNVYTDPSTGNYYVSLSNFIWR